MLTETSSLTVTKNINHSNCNHTNHQNTNTATVNKSRKINTTLNQRANTHLHRVMVSSHGRKVLEVSVISPKARWPRRHTCCRPMVMESLGRCRRRVTTLTTSGRNSCSLMTARLQVTRGGEVGITFCPSWLISSETKDGQAAERPRIIVNSYNAY